jgi:hypothetical protein
VLTEDTAIDTEKDKERIDKTQMAVVHVLEEAIKALKDYPEALDAYFSAEKKAIIEHRWVPDLLSSLLFTLKTQCTILDTIKRNPNAYKVLEYAESIALEASTTVLRIAKVNPPALEKYLNAQREFYASYNDTLEWPFDNVYALRNFIIAEIEVLENKELVDKAIHKAHSAIVKAIKAALKSLEEYPEALIAFLKAERASLETTGDVGLAQSLLDSHVLMLKAHRAMLNIYDASPNSYKVFTEMATLTLDTRKEIYNKIRNPDAKKLLEGSLAALNIYYKNMLRTPTENIDVFRNFLDNEIARLQEIEKIPMAEMEEV